MGQKSPAAAGWLVPEQLAQHGSAAAGCTPTCSGTQGCVGSPVHPMAKCTWLLSLPLMYNQTGNGRMAARR